MRIRPVTRVLLIAAAAALAVALAPAASDAQRSKAKMSVPPGGCATTTGVLENGQTCTAACNEFQWCAVQWCFQGKLEQTVFACWEPSGVCQPKC